MAFKYFKVPPHMAVEMNIANIQEKRLKDGNYLAIYDNFATYGLQPFEAERDAQSMGCLALAPFEMVQEVRGEVVRPLPQPTNPRFFPPKNFDPLTGNYVNGKEEERPEEENDEPSESVEVGEDVQEIEIVIKTNNEEEEEIEESLEETDAESVDESEDENTPNEEGGE